LQFLLTLNPDRTWTISEHSPKPSANSLPSYDEWVEFFNIRNPLKEHREAFAKKWANQAVIFLAQRG